MKWCCFFPDHWHQGRKDKHVMEELLGVKYFLCLFSPSDDSARMGQQEGVACPSNGGSSQHFVPEHNGVELLPPSSG
eukprot:5390877-Amphidinium_carterae.1